jgi:Mn-dependent DtxR family transcriptional regulator
MSFITESKKAYNQVKENHVAIAMGNMLDDEGSMLLNQLEELERGIEMLRAYVGNDYEKQLPAWVQSKVTLATDYISTAGNYLSSKNEKVTEETIKESSHLTESTFEKIYQMQQDGKSTEDIAKELKLNPALVKKVLGEQIELKEFTDAMLAALKKEYEPLKGKTITTAQYQQLKNILFKLQDADLEKLQKQNIPFASTGAGSILRVRKSFSHLGAKITSVKVPGLEGMAEENDYVAVHVKKGKTSVTANSSYEAAKKASEKFGLKNTAGVTVYLTKKDGKEIIHKATEEVEESFKDNIVNKLVKPVQDYNKKAAEKRTIDMTDGSAHVRFPKDDTRAMEFYKSKGYKVTTKYEGAKATVEKAFKKLKEKK